MSVTLRSAAIGDVGSMLNTEDVKSTFVVYCEQEGYMTYVGIDEMVD